MSENLLTLKQAAQRLGVSYSFIFRAYGRGLISTVKCGRLVRISEDDLALWIDAHRIAKAAIAATAEARAERDKTRRHLRFLVADDLSEPQA